MNIEYIDTIQPRISDINYGGHVGHVELINLLHEVRVKFLYLYSLKETDINGHVLIMHNLNVTYINQVFWNNKLEIKMKIKADRARILFDYKIYNITLQNEAAIAAAKMVLLNKEKERPAKPENFIRIINNDNNERKHHQQ